jgi:hypothetical protein
VEIELGSERTFKHEAFQPIDYAKKCALTHAFGRDRQRPSSRSNMSSGGGWNSAFGIDGGGNLATDPDLFFGLADNGGFTPTIQPFFGSFSVDAGLDSACSAPLNAQDQRGAPRIAGAHCDIGAVETAYLVLSVSDGNAFAPYGKPLEYIVTITNYSSTLTASNIRVFATASAALNLAGADWFCTGGGGGAACTTASTQGPFGDLATLPPVDR